MMKISDDAINGLENGYPGIKEQIARLENAKLPACPHCGSEATAEVQCGIIGRTIAISAATTKIKLVADPNPGKYYCNSCGNYFD